MPLPLAADDIVLSFRMTQTNYLWRQRWDFPKLTCGLNHRSDPH
jgi:hypothetical protein